MRYRAPWLAAAAAGAALAAAAAVAVASDLSRLNLEETQLSAEQAHNLSQLARLLSVLAQLRRDPPPALLVSPRDAKDAVRAAILVRAMTPELQRRAKSYAREADEMMRLRRLAAVQSETLFAADSARAEALPEPAGAPLPPREVAETLPPGRLIAPVAGPVVRRFGAPLLSGGRADGLTIAAGPRAGVASPDAAVVQYVGPVKGWGVILILRLAGGYHVVLAGMDRASVSVGQSVAAGQAVGWMPDGRQSAVELYLEVRDQGAPVDPMRWMRSAVG